MLPKQYRLPAKLIPLLARKGKRLGNETVDIRYLPGEGFQFAISISTKVSKSAVVRNRIRRRLRAMLLKTITASKLPTGKYLLIVKSIEIENWELGQNFGRNNTLCLNSTVSHHSS